MRNTPSLADVHENRGNLKLSHMKTLMRKYGRDNMAIYGDELHLNGEFYGYVEQA